MKWLVSLIFLYMSAVPSVFAASVQDFSFKDIDGKSHRFSQYRGKWVIVNYWSMDCSPCLQEIPALKGIAQRYKHNTVVLGMDVGETATPRMKQFMRQRGINYIVAPTQDSTLFALGLIYGVPTTYIVSPKGEIVDTHVGVITLQQMQRYVGGGANR